MENLEQLIKKCKFNYVNTDITEEHFPLEKIRGKVKIFHFDRFISSEDVIKKMEKEEYQPANIYELLEYAEKDWNGKDTVVALDFVWCGLGGRGVASLWGDSGGRGLRLSWFGRDWFAGCRFAAVCKSSEINPLKEVELETRIRMLEEKINKNDKPHICPPCMLPHYPNNYAQPSRCPYCGSIGACWHINMNPYITY